MTRTYINYINPENFVTPFTFNPNLYRSIMPNGCYDTDNKVIDIWKKEQFDWIICLCKKGEFLRKVNNTQDGTYSSIYSEYKCINLPIENYETPTSFKHLLIVLEELDRLLLEGNKCVVHCSAGIGRTGLLVACYLIYRGSSVDEAVKITRSNIPPALGQKAQLDYLQTFQIGCFSKIK
jgi:protein tyrosine/serine phosphatase